MKRHPVLVFVLLALIFSWSLIIPVALASHGKITLPSGAAKAVKYFAYAPVLAALIVTFLAGGVGALRSLLGRFGRWRVGLGWYAIAIVLPILPLVLHMLFGGGGPQFTVITEPQPGTTTPTLTPLNPWAQILPILWYELLKSKVFADELAWRGFLLPQMQRRMNALLASIMVGAVWCLSLLPLVFVKSGPSAGLQWIYLALGTVATSVTFTWIFNSSKGSLLTVVLFSLSNAVVDAFLQAAGVQNVLLVITNVGVAAIVVALAGPKHLTRDPARAAAAIADDPHSPTQETA